uniref:Uncharacterized protein n=1 Tax=Mycena chlorophos TaxID=658473 RepID=A0ABQ0LL70_MYCCL|nr:predicted protein [Mycena chlorophos]
MSRRQPPQAAGPGPGGPTAQRFLQHNFPFVSGLQNATFENCTWRVTEADGTVRSGRVTRDGQCVSGGGEEVPEPRAAAAAAAETSDPSSKTRESDEHIGLTQTTDKPAAPSRTQTRAHPSPSPSPNPNPFPSTVRNTIKFYSYDDFLLHGVYKPVPPPSRTRPGADFSARPPAGRFESPKPATPSSDSTPGTSYTTLRPGFHDRRNRPTGDGPTRKRGFAKRQLERPESAHIEELDSDEDE